MPSFSFKCHSCFPNFKQIFLLLVFNTFWSTWMSRAVCNLLVHKEFWSSVALARNLQPASPCYGSSDATLPQYLHVQCGAQHRGTLLHRSSSWQTGICSLPPSMPWVSQIAWVSHTWGPWFHRASYGKNCALTGHSQCGSGTEPQLDSTRKPESLQEICRHT